MDISNNLDSTDLVFNTYLNVLLAILIFCFYYVYCFTGDIDENEVTVIVGGKLPILVTLLLVCLTLSTPYPLKKVFIIMLIISCLVTAIGFFGVLYVSAYGKDRIDWSYWRKL